jgi:hypothetical protein
MTSDNSPQPISPLRARMIEDMSLRGFKEDSELAARSNDCLPGSSDRPSGQGEGQLRGQPV